MNNQTTAGMTLDQIEHGTPENKKLILKSFFKDDKCTISPAKDVNGRYKGIKENIPESEKLKMGYVADVHSKMKVYDGMEIDLNDTTWAKDWEWMKHCNEIAEDFEQGQKTPGAYFYIYRPGVEAAKKVTAIEREFKLMRYIIEDSADNLYNRSNMLGFNMKNEPISDVKELLFGLVKTNPKKIAAIYESKTFSLELLLMHAIEKTVVSKRGGVYVFGEVLLGVDKKAVVRFFADLTNVSTTRAIEALTYGNKKVVKNPLADEVVNTSDDTDFEEADKGLEETANDNVITHNEATSEMKDRGIGNGINDGEDKKNEMLDNIKSKAAQRQKNNNK